MSLYKNKLKDLGGTKKDIKIAFVSTDFNKDLVELLEGVTEEFLNNAGYKNINKFYVPGALEIPSMLNRILKKQDYDLIYCFGVVIRGETTHYEIVTRESSRGIMDMTMKYPETGIIMGILTCENIKQVKERINNSLVISGLNLLNEIQKIG